MRARPTDPRRLDVQAFARDGGRLEGTWPAASLPRLLSSVVEPGDAVWRAEGECRKPNSVQPETWLRLTAQATVDLECQRCLGAVRTPLGVDRLFRFVEGEELAAEMDAEEEFDVLALPRWLDLLDLVDEELLLALPLVPRHEHCPEPLPMSSGPDGDAMLDDEAPNPFAALAALKRGGPSGSN